jgi:hypothetical protein
VIAIPATASTVRALRDLNTGPLPSVRCRTAPWQTERRGAGLIQAGFRR